MSIKPMNLLDVNPLEHITGDVAISQYNYESILNGLVQWDQCKSDTITIRVATRTEPYFVDYEIPTKYFYDKNYGVAASIPLLPANSFSYENRVKLSVAQDDHVVLRLNVRDAGNTEWRLYKDVVVYDEFDKEPTEVNHVYRIGTSTTYKHAYVPGIYIRVFIDGEFRLYKTIGNINAGNPIDLTDSDKVVPVVHAISTMKTPNPIPAFCLFVGSNPEIAYERNENVPTESGYLLTRNNAYVEYCNSWQEDVVYTKGTVVYYKGDFFVSVVDNPSAPPVIIEMLGDVASYGNMNYRCTYHMDSWEPALLMAVDFDPITGTQSKRLTADTDVSAYVLRNVLNESSETTSISIVGNINIVGKDSSQPTGLNIMPTSNYVDWPITKITKWTAGSVYTADASRSAYSKQDYSAVMTFNHIDVDLAYKHIINYDGPDVDQGLCIMLPVTVLGEDNTTHDPQDGTMLEFMFNIWPNHAYGKADNDLIINKSQIYVYSVPNYSDFRQYGFTPSTVMPIAKFSMSRLINFYVFSENIGVPDRPVCYKARFIYSKSEHAWKTYDYYQLPDHIFMSPHGFVDPSDIKAYDVESAGFPLYQNPFSSYDMSPIHVGKDFLNQIQKPGKNADK